MATSWEHQREVRDALRTIVADPQLGVPALLSAQTLSNLLKDLLPDAPRETSVLVAAAEAGLAGVLQDHLGQGMDLATASSLAASAFEARTPFTPDACRWAVGELSVALGYAPPDMPPASGMQAGTIVETSGFPSPGYRPGPGSPVPGPAAQGPPGQSPPGPGYGPPPGGAGYGTGRPDRAAAGYGYGYGQGPNPAPPPPAASPAGGAFAYPPPAAPPAAGPGYGYQGPGQGGYAYPPTPVAGPGYGPYPGAGQQEPPRRRLKLWFWLGGVAVVLVIVILLAAIGARLKQNSNTPQAGVESLSQLIQPDVVSCKTTTPSLGMTGLSHKEFCTTKTSDIGLDAYQFTSTAAFTAGLAKWNSLTSWDAGAAGRSCPPPSGSTGGLTPWHSNVNAKFHSHAGQLLECYSFHGYLLYLWTLPTQRVILVGNDHAAGATYSIMEKWWAGLNYG